MIAYILLQKGAFRTEMPVFRLGPILYSFLSSMLNIHPTREPVCELISCTSASGEVWVFAGIILERSKTNDVWEVQHVQNPRSNVSDDIFC